MRRPLIGITTYHRETSGRSRFTVPSAYVDALRAARGLAVLFAGVVSQVRYVPMAGLTGSSTARTLNVYNRGQAGAGTTVVATKAQTAGVNSASKTPNAITLSGTAANLVVAANDVLEWESLHVSTGITYPGGIVEIDISRQQSE